MIDGFKILNLKAPDILNNPLLEFPLSVSDHTAEILNRTRVATFNGISFIHKNNITKLYGSFHKYHNSGLHNYNDFYFADLLNVIIAYWNNFKINPFENVLNNLEFGVNILANCNISNLFKMILKHKGKSFQKFNINGSIGIECIHND